MAFTLNYVWPPTGAIAPTASQVATKMIVDVTATADSDTEVFIFHLMKQTPLEVTLTNILGPVFTSSASWTVTQITSTYTSVKKSPAMNTGQPVPQLRVIIGLPHTLVL